MSKTGGARARKVRTCGTCRKSRQNVRFMSIEPLWFDVAPVFEEWLETEGELPFEWAIIGAASNGSRVFQPKTEWTISLLDILENRDVPVFFKGNMDSGIWTNWREEFPAA